MRPKILVPQEKRRDNPWLVVGGHPPGGQLFLPYVPRKIVTKLKAEVETKKSYPSYPFEFIMDYTVVGMIKNFFTCFISYQGLNEVSFI